MGALTQGRGDTDATDVVVLVPGFFGFERFAGFYYFAERVGATIRAAVEAKAGYRVPVVALSTLPAGRFIDRQRVLFSQLHRLVRESFRHAVRIHLVGHSAGGVDAYLATCARAVDGRVWRDWEDAIRNSITTVVTLASPHLGTSLSASRVSKFVSRPTRHLPALPQVFAVTSDMARLVAGDPFALERIGAVLGAWPDACKFACQLFWHRELIEELDPRQMAAFYRAYPRDARVRLKCFVSAVSRETLPRSSSFFRSLYEMTADSADTIATSADVSAITQLLNARRTEVISSSSGYAPAFDPTVSDGVVNSVRQLPAPDPELLAGIILADHADLIGYYDRDDLLSGRSYDESVFRSGADFRDDAFFRVYERVAHEIHMGISDAVDREREAVPPPPSTARFDRDRDAENKGAVS